MYIQLCLLLLSDKPSLSELAQLDHVCPTLAIRHIERVLINWNVNLANLAMADLVPNVLLEVCVYYSYYSLVGLCITCSFVYLSNIIVLCFFIYTCGIQALEQHQQIIDSTGTTSSEIGTRRGSFTGISSSTTQNHDQNRLQWDPYLQVPLCVDIQIARFYLSDVTIPDELAKLSQFRFLTREDDLNTTHD